MSRVVKKVIVPVTVVQEKKGTEEANVDRKDEENKHQETETETARKGPKFTMETCNARRCKQDAKFYDCTGAIDGVYCAAHTMPIFATRIDDSKYFTIKPKPCQKYPDVETMKGAREKWRQAYRRALESGDICRKCSKPAYYMNLAGDREAVCHLHTMEPMFTKGFVGLHELHENKADIDK